MLAAYRSCLGQPPDCRPGIVETSPDGSGAREVRLPGDAPVGWLAWSPGGTRHLAVMIAAGSELANQVAIVEPDGSIRTVEIGASHEIWRAGWSSDGQAIVYSAARPPSSPSSIWSVDPAAGTPTLLVGDADPSISGE